MLYLNFVLLSIIPILQCIQHPNSYFIIEHIKIIYLHNKLGAKICYKHICRSCCKQDEVVTYDANMCPCPCACHMTSPIHLTIVTTYTTDLSLPTQVKQNSYHLSLCHPTLLYLSKSLHNWSAMLTSSKITVKNN